MTSKLKNTIILALFFIVIGFLVWQHVSGQVIDESVDLMLDEQAVVSAHYLSHPFINAYNQQENAVLIDIRTPEEYQAGHIEGAINIDYYDPLFTQSIKHLAGDRAVFMYCRSGNRSSDALVRLSKMNLEVYEMRGGILSYRGDLVRD